MIRLRKKNQADKYYFNHPEVWEALRDGIPLRQSKFINDYIKLNKLKIKSILDVGAGTGTHCFILNQMGYETTGIDLNDHMISYANERYPDISFIKADMKRLKKVRLKKRYDALICLCTTFSYNLNNQEILNTLKGFNKHIRKGGIIVLDVFNPIVFLQKKKFAGSFFPESESSYSKAGFKLKLKHTVLEKEQLLREDKNMIATSTGEEVAEDTTYFRMFFPQEMNFFLEMSGFKLLDQFGDYDLDHKDLDESEFISIAKKI